MNPQSNSRRLIYGVVIGIVQSNSHPNGEYKVKCKFPWIFSTENSPADKEDFFSTWCRISTPMAGPGRGFWCLPEVDDEVLVMFEHGDVNRPVVIGSMWNGKDLPPVGDKAPAVSTTPTPPSAGGGVDLGLDKSCVDTTDQKDKNNAKNRARFFYSRSGHLLLFDDGADESDEKIVLKTKKGHVVVLNDKSGDEAIAIYDSTGNEYIYIDEANERITIETKNGDIDVFCKNGTYTVEADKIITKAKNTAEHEAKETTHKSSSKHTIDGGSLIDADAGTIELN